MIWAPLRAEIASWQAEALSLTLWWRDDDAVAPTRQLDRLVRLSETSGVSVRLAVIPAHAQEALAEYVRDAAVLRPVVHGWAHVNHAPEGQKSSEFGTARDGALSDAAQGLARLRALFGTALEPVFVPPWNRIDASVVNGLADIGFAALSTYGPRKTRFAADGLVQINTHIDPVDWRGTRGLSDPDLVIARLVEQLRDRRIGRADNDEPLGLLTHHLMQDDATWNFCAGLLSELQAINDNRDLDFS